MPAMNFIKSSKVVRPKPDQPDRLLCLWICSILFVVGEKFLWVTWNMECVTSFKIFRIHLWSRGDRRKWVHSSKPRQHIWLEEIWNSSSFSQRQPSTQCGRMQDQHQSESPWAVSASWGFGPSQPCFLDHSILQVHRAGHIGNPALCTHRWGNIVSPQLCFCQMLSEGPTLQV